MGFQESVVSQVVYYPSTTILISLCCVVWLLIQKFNLSYTSVGYNYKKVVQEHQYWRIITATCSHISLIHLLFNTSSMWALRHMEIQYGLIGYFRITVLVAVVSFVFMITIHSFLHRILTEDASQRTFALGISCVLFGWLTIHSVQASGQQFYFFGVFPTPVYLAPLSSLVITKIFVPQSSLFGHICGITAGYSIHLGIFWWYSDFIFLLSFPWLLIYMLHNFKSHSDVEVDFIRKETLNPLPTSHFHLQHVPAISDSISMEPLPI